MTSSEADENERIFLEDCRKVRKELEENKQWSPEYKQKIQRHMLQFDERERIYTPVPIPEYERGDA